MSKHRKRATLGLYSCALLLGAVLGASCIAEPRDDAEESDSEQDVSPTVLAASAEASRIIERVQEDMFVRPTLPPFDRLAEPEDDKPVAALPSSETSGFVVEGESILPVFEHSEEEATLAVRLPQRANGVLEIRDEASGLSVRATLDGADDTEAEVADGYLVFSGALDDADIIHRVGRDSVEDYFRFEEAPTEPELRYSVELGDTVAGLRLVDDTLEFMEANGTPRLRVSRPYLVDSAGTRRDASLDLEGCEYSDDPRAPWGEPVVAPGSAACQLVVRWDDDELDYPILVDPSWTPTGNMVTGRERHQASVLPNGNVLAVGGVDAFNSVLFSANIYDVATATWAATGPMANSRYQFAVAAVANGGTNYILAAGGLGNCTGGYCGAERYDVALGTWGAAGTMVANRVSLSMVVLRDGTGRAFAAGGYNASVLSTAETYDPSTNSWTGTAGGLAVERWGHAMGALSSANASRVIVFGGFNNAGTILSSAERFLPSTGLFSTAGTPTTPRAFPRAIVNPGDAVFAVAGQMDATNCAARMQAYNPATNAWTNKATGYARCLHTATLLANGTQFIVAGGRATPSGTGSNATTLYDMTFNTWTVGPTLNTSRYHHTATLYPSSPVSKVLVAGGKFSTTALAASEFYTP